MLSREQYFPGQGPEEQVALFIRRHWMAFIPWILLTPILLLALTFGIFIIWHSPALALENSTDWRAVLVTLATSFYLAIIFAFFRAWMSYYLDVTIVTERRLVDIQQQGIFVRRISEQSLLRVQDVTARQRDFFHHFFNYGTLYIETAGQERNFELKNIPRPNDIANTIMDLHERLVGNGDHRREEMIAEGDFQPHAPKQTNDFPKKNPRHPLEELRPFFPEPSQTASAQRRAKELAELTKKSKGSSDDSRPPEELREGEVINFDE